MKTFSEVDLNARTFNKKFKAWLEENPHIWEAFVRNANEIRSRGRKHYSARTIVEYLRHNSSLREASGEWKINNIHIPDMARLYMLLNPDAKDFFSLRESEARGEGC